MKNQLNADTKECGEYRALLDKCLFCLNRLPNQRIPDGDGGSTYKLASEIDAVFKKVDSGTSA